MRGVVTATPAVRHHGQAMRAGKDVLVKETACFGRGRCHEGLRSCVAVYAKRTSGASE